MKNLCYNKDTKEKGTNKKCFNLTKKGVSNRCTNKIAKREFGEKGCRDATKNLLIGGYEKR